MYALIIVTGTLMATATGYESKSWCDVAAAEAKSGGADKAFCIQVPKDKNILGGAGTVYVR